MTDTIRLERKDGIAVVSLAQGARGNPFDGAFVRDFKQVFSDLWDDATATLRVVLLRAEGANFSVGGDLKSVRLALTGRERGPELKAVIAALPRDELLRRALG